MENWGAIFFRDSRLLVDDQLASTGTKRIVANVIVHEIVHQWFGNLVTMWWWDDLWLNEAFATWLAVKIVDQWRPEWNSWVEFQQEKQIPFSVDALESTRPISSKVTSAAQIEELFDALTYEKGAAVLRMIEQFLGETAFRDGIRRYIAAHQYGNAPAADLWAALEAASGQPVPAIAHDWFTQPGFPLITLSQDDARTFNVTQQRFHAVEQVASTRSTARWTVPVILKFHDEYGVHTHPFLLREASAVVTLPGTGPIQWILANSGESGFFRTHYEPALQEAVRTIAATQLEPAERIGLLDHLRALSQAGTLPIDEWMDCLVRFQGDRTRVVVQTLADQLELLSNQFITADDHSLMAGLAMELFDPLWQHFGWGPRPNNHEDDETRLARAACLWALGRIAQPSSLLREAADRFERYLADPASLDPTLATPVVRLHAGFGDAKQFDRYIELFTHAQTPEERDRYLLALADFPDPALARRYLEFSLSDGVRSQDAWKPMRYLLAHPAHPPVQTEAWTFMQSRWDRLREKTGSVGAMRMIQGLRHVWRSDWHDDVRRFFDDPAHRVPSAERALAQTLEFIRIGIAFKERQQTALSNWLKKHGPGRGR
jgi:puromycin-sensitive aminopeptidase